MEVQFKTSSKSSNHDRYSLGGISGPIGGGEAFRQYHIAALRESVKWGTNFSWCYKPERTGNRLTNKWWGKVLIK